MARKQRFVEFDGVDAPAVMVDGLQHDGESRQSRLQNANESVAESRDCQDTKTQDSISNLTVEPSNSLNIDALRREKRERKPRAKRGVAKRKHDLERARSRALPEDSKVTFAPTPDKRAEMVEVLARRPNDRERRRLLKRLTTEFVRIYKRFRGEVQDQYVMDKSERKQAGEAARLCVIKGVTPRQLIEYWVDNIGNFTGMSFPPLHFLASPGNVDRVAVEVAVHPKRPKASRHRRDKSPTVHGYSDTGRLDPRLRRGLAEAGLDVNDFSDRYLMTVQTTARAIATGRDIFVSSRMKPFVSWAAKHLYSDED